MNSFALPVSYSPNPVFPNPNLETYPPRDSFIDLFSNFWTPDVNPRSQLSATSSIVHVDPPFLESASILSLEKNLEPMLGDLTNWSAAHHSLASEEFDPLLAGGQVSNTEMSTEFPFIGESNLTPLSREDQVNSTSSLPIPAFPRAEGFGALSVGGRGGRVIEVTNLYDRGPGSLRSAMEAEGARIVVFRVGGTIRLRDTIRIKDPYLTVAGQTAPGGGILLKGTQNTLIRIEDGAHDIILRYLRLRNGSEEANGFGYDNIAINGGYNILLDHLSLSWSSDENASIYRKADDPSIYNVTIQRSILGEGLDGHSNGLIVSGETNFSNPDNPIEAWKDIRNISIHHNLFIHNSHRNPRVTAAGTEVINNVIYNWKYRIGETTRGSVIDFINNYAQAGPVSNLDRLFLHENSSPAHPNDPYPNPSIYTQGNIVDPVQTDPNANNWDLWKLNYTYNPLPESYRRSTPLQQPPIPIMVQSANEAYESVLEDVGVNARLNCQGDWVFNADDVDRRYLFDIINHWGYDEPISRPYDGGGYPDIDPGTPCTDSDRDGMPDLWESQNQFNPQDPSDGSTDADGDGYTNIEEYLNGSF